MNTVCFEERCLELVINLCLELEGIVSFCFFILTFCNIYFFILYRLTAQKKAKSVQNTLSMDFLHLSCSKMEERFVVGYYKISTSKEMILLTTGLEISACPLANASVKPVRRVEISGYSPGLASTIFIFRKIKL